MNLRGFVLEGQPREFKGKFKGAEIDVDSLYGRLTEGQRNGDNHGGRKSRFKGNRSDSDRSIRCFAEASRRAPAAPPPPPPPPPEHY